MPKSRAKRFDEAARTRDLGTLVKMAVEDTLAVVGEDIHDLYMYSWIKKRPDGSCSVCMAGAVMLGTLAVDYRKLPLGECCPDKFFSTEQLYVVHALKAINCVRLGRKPNVPGYFYDEEEGVSEALREIIYHFDGRLGRAPWRYYRAFVEAWESSKPKETTC